MDAGTSGYGAHISSSSWVLRELGDMPSAEPWLGHESLYTLKSMQHGVPLVTNTHTTPPPTPPNSRVDVALSQVEKPIWLIFGPQSPRNDILSPYSLNSLS